MVLFVPALASPARPTQLRSGWPSPRAWHATVSQPPTPAAATRQDRRSVIGCPHWTSATTRRPSAATVVRLRRRWLAGLGDRVRRREGVSCIDDAIRRHFRGLAARCEARDGELEGTAESPEGEAAESSGALKEYPPVERGRILGATVLVASSCTGASMLALPAVQYKAGFLPSSVCLFFCWAYMCLTGLLMVEVNVAVGEGANLSSMAEATLGKLGRLLTIPLVLIGTAAVICAYIVEDGRILGRVLAEQVGAGLDPALGPVLFAAAFGLLVFAGTSTVDIANRFLSVAWGVLFLTLVGIALPDIDPALLVHQNWAVTFGSLSVAINAFIYHSVLPSVLTYVRGNPQAAKEAVIYGTGFPLLVYIIWDAAVLGITPFRGWRAWEGSGGSVLQALETATGNPALLPVANVFAFLAVVTSFLGLGVGFVDFLADAFRVQNEGWRRAVMCCLAFCPPLLFAVYNPDVFFQALAVTGVAGTCLTGVLPAAMVYSLRYGLPEWMRFGEPEPQAELEAEEATAAAARGGELVPLPREAVGGLVGFSVALVLYQVWEQFISPLLAPVPIVTGAG
eukprot:tig00020996_g16931.t1